MHIFYLMMKNEFYLRTKHGITSFASGFFKQKFENTFVNKNTTTENTSTDATLYDDSNEYLDSLKFQF